MLKQAAKTRKKPVNSTPPADPPASLAAQGAAALDAGARALDYCLAAGFARLEPPILQPAAVFLDVAGEDIRGRLYLASDAEGAELCLRPDYTVPVCLAYLASPEAGRLAQYAYFGPVFRARPGQSGEMIQTGLESYGRTDIEAADAEILGIALEAADRAGAGALKVRIGDARLFDSALTALRLPQSWLRRLRRGLARGRSLETILANGGGAGALAQSGVLAALESADHAGAKALVEDLLAIAGIATVGGRSVGEIADRFLEQAAQRSQTHVGAEQQEAIRRFLAISGDPDSASRDLRQLAKDASLNIGPALDSFDQRVGFLAARGLKIDDFAYSAAFVRDLDYYTGFVFEAVDAADPGARPAVGGGRYDGLARRLGASADVPAIGAAIWIDRLPPKGARP
ncbi:MAG: ATP phosphoribosyltransferase regulatory subunit [Bradyrhizobium sp.]|nr:MAG: ATP phosphoribosyltransferase regulatory subunit [Bradyrhizobium sp.]